MGIPNKAHVFVTIGFHHVPTPWFLLSQEQAEREENHADRLKERERLPIFEAGSMWDAKSGTRPGKRLQKTMERSTIFWLGKSTISTGPCSIAIDIDVLKK